MLLILPEQVQPMAPHLNYNFFTDLHLILRFMETVLNMILETFSGVKIEMVKQFMVSCNS